MENNEIKYGQMDFNLPHDVVPLPSQGIFYKNKKKSVKVGYLTAQDENLLTSPNMDPTQIISTLLRSKIYEPEFKIDEMLAGDVEAVLLFLRNTAFGSDYTIRVVDPGTMKPFELTLDLSELNIRNNNIVPDSNGHIDTLLPVSGDNVKLRFLTYGEENAIDAEMDKYPKNMVVPKVTKKLETQIVSINGNSEKMFISQYVQKMPIKDSKHIRKFLLDSEPSLDLKKKVKAPSGEEVDVNIGFGVEFFRPFFGL